MGSKRKTESKAKEKPATKAGTTKHSEQKASEVIPEVEVALLAANPGLPDQAMILEEFSRYFRAAKERTEALAAARAASALADTGDGERQRGAERKRRTTAETGAGRASTRVVSPSRVLAGEAPEAIAPDAASAEPAAPQPVEAELETSSLFATIEAEATREPEDLFALLAGEMPAKTDDDFGFGQPGAADQSSPFLSAPLGLASEDGATLIGDGLDDDALFGTPVAEEALPEDEEAEAPTTLAPDEATTMIQAMPDDEPAEPEVSTGRKSRKASKKRRG